MLGRISGKVWSLLFAVGLALTATRKDGTAQIGTGPEDMEDDELPSLRLGPAI